MLRQWFLALVGMCLFAQPYTTTFNTPDEAAKAITSYLKNDPKIKLDKGEYCCIIYIKNDKYGYTLPNVGDRNSVSVPFTLIPQDAKYYSALHNHPKYLYPTPTKADLVVTAILDNDKGVFLMDRGFGTWAYLYLPDSGTLNKFRIRPGKLLKSIPESPMYFIDYEMEKIK